MKIIMKTELLTIVVDQFKHRMYCTMQGFWQYDTDKAAHMRSVFQQLSQEQMMHNGTVVLNTAGLHIMQPRVAEHFLPAFTKCLLDHRIKALAHVGNPDNVLLRMQFERVLQGVQRSNEVRHETFQEQQDAETWLDTMWP